MMTYLKDIMINCVKFVLWLFVHNLMVLPVFLFYFLKFGHGTFAQITLTILCSAIGLITIAFLYKHYRSTLNSNNPQHFMFRSIFKEKPWKWIFTAIITIGWIVLQFNWPGESSGDENATVGLLSLYPVPMFIVVSILGPIYEELLNRGLFFSYFIKSNAWCARVLGLSGSSLVFGLLHSTSISWATLGYVISGIVLGLIYLITKNIRFGILAHLVNNIIAAVG